MIVKKNGLSPHPIGIKPVAYFLATFLGTAGLCVLVLVVGSLIGG